jgi:single-strand DNA-binding protein
VAGDLSTREHDGKTYLTVRADQVTLLGGGEQRQQQSNGDQSRGQSRADLDDEIPF